MQNESKDERKNGRFSECTGWEGQKKKKKKKKKGKGELGEVEEERRKEDEFILHSIYKMNTVRMCERACVFFRSSPSDGVLYFRDPGDRRGDLEAQAQVEWIAKIDRWIEK